MLTVTNLFDYFEELAEDGDAGSYWAARTPLRPSDRFDIKLVPRQPGWREHSESLDALERIERESWVGTVERTQSGAELRLSDDWIESLGTALQEGDTGEDRLTDLAAGRRFSVQFWDANATKALHVGHLRNLAIGNALAAALAQAGGQVERRALISDAGRSMGEAMAGVMQSGRHAQAWPDRNEKSDHFVGCCYAEYVAAGRSFGARVGDGPEDALERELTLRDDDADELLRRVLSGDREALELWYKTRAWVIAGQRKTLQRLGIAFDRVFFESDFLSEAAELAACGLRDGLLRRREDGIVIYPSGREDFDELPLVRDDDLPTQHMRAMAYWMAAPGLDGMTSVQVCGAEWVSHVICRRQLMGRLMGADAESMHPSSDIFHGMVTRKPRTQQSGEEGEEGEPLLIDELTEWLEGEIERDPRGEQVVRALGPAEAVAGQVALGYFLPRPVTPRVDFQPERLLDERESPGWELALARARQAPGPEPTSRPSEDADYRFAVVQSELHRRHLRLAVERLDAGPLARYVTHFARWYSERDRSGPVERVAHTLLARGAHGLGLEQTP